MGVKEGGLARLFIICCAEARDVEEMAEPGISIGRPAGRSLIRQVAFEVHIFQVIQFAACLSMPMSIASDRRTY